jgi:hypothetical protein
MGVHARESGHDWIESGQTDRRTDGQTDGPVRDCRGRRAQEEHQTRTNDGSIQDGAATGRGRSASRAENSAAVDDWRPAGASDCCLFVRRTNKIKNKKKGQKVPKALCDCSW